MKRNNNFDIKKISALSMLLAVSVIMGYLEFLIPFNFGIPGIKLGLANIVTVIILYIYGLGYSLAIGLLRILIIGFLFGNFSYIIYSFSGLILALLIMALLKRIGLFKVFTVSALGGVFHNLGQIFIAYFVCNTPVIFYYSPVLILAGVLCGLITGIISQNMINFILSNKDRFL